MKYQLYLPTVASIAALACCTSLTALGQKSSPSPAATTKASPAAKAASSPTTAASSTTAETKAPRAIPFRGTATSLDQSAKSFTIAGKSSSRVFKVTDKTTVTKAGAAATFADLTENEPVTGSYWKHEDGTLEAKSLKIGGKTDAEKAATKSKKKDDAAADE